MDEQPTAENFTAYPIFAEFVPSASSEEAENYV